MKVTSIKKFLSRHVCEVEKKRKTRGRESGERRKEGREKGGKGERWRYYESNVKKKDRPWKQQVSKRCPLVTICVYI